MSEELKLFVLNFCVSGCSAAISKTLISPLERTKLILQNQELADKMLKGERQKYKGMLDTLIRLPKEEGLLSYWRGNGTNLMRYIPLQSMNFSFFNYYYHTLTKYFKNNEMATINSFLAGGLAGLTSISMVFPLDLCVTKLATDFGLDAKRAEERGLPPREFTGLKDCLIRVAKADGILGIYKGFSASAIGLSIYRCIYFGLFEVVKNNKIGNRNFRESNFFLKFLIAQLTTTTASFLTYPFDTVSRRMILDANRPKELRQIRNLRHSFQLIFRNEGFSGFYKGAFTNLLRSSGGALVLVLYDEILDHTQFKQVIVNRTYQKIQESAYTLGD